MCPSIDIIKKNKPECEKVSTIYTFNNIAFTNQ